MKVQFTVMDERLMVETMLLGLASNFGNRYIFQMATPVDSLKSAPQSCVRSASINNKLT